MRIISHRQYVTVQHYEIFFQYQDAVTYHGFGFPALKSGQVDMVELEKRPAALASYRRCLSGEIKVKSGVFRSWEHSYSEPAIGECICGCEVQLDSFTSTCDVCGRDYNMSGQELAPRNQWGEETGESYCDIQDL